MNQYLILLTALAAALLVCLPTAFAVSCYSCNTKIDGDGCRKPLDDKFLINCDSESLQLQEEFGVSRNFSMCRIFYQDVEGDSRIVRTCASAGKPERGCIDRTGTKNIKLSYCECEGDGCNAAGKLTSHGIVLSLLMLVIAALRM